ncbi:PREDICTED: phosphoinositide 3-kinase regulatory subunit 4-like [Priapulus caudatus]|uniref:non-specific serine/threonine protein kinase n=1 Tax=Priapulus caudatus TaxID=37621 RepID=A0ABM1EHK7_PRICU|nr:PREDICTED: phosphoinositide 3-kinase regulatory subunit 4-like [Priapulus caudatus]
MGNQLTGIAPAQILSVDHYFSDLPEYEYDISLGSTRFFKVARAKCKEGLTVVKIFAIHDPSLPLKTYRDNAEEIKQRLQGATNCLPFQRAVITDKAGLLIRSYVKANLYDRISTRPFVNAVEKKYLAFQILCAINQCHKQNVCHGDIKSENVMVTSWNWVLLTDFASFKPTYLPEDNPADFSYFFDTSRRRTCYIAPERFVRGTWSTSEGEAAGNSGAPNIVVLPDTDTMKCGDLTPAMDVFSAGCVLAELFTEGHPPFDLSQLLSYISGEYTPTKVMERIDDECVRELIAHMLQKDPSLRLSAEEYLTEQRGKAFPEYFYTFLKVYLQGFSCAPVLTSDDKISRLKKDINKILKTLCDSDTESDRTPVQDYIEFRIESHYNYRYHCLWTQVGEAMVMLHSAITANLCLQREQCAITARLCLQGGLVIIVAIDKLMLRSLRLSITSDTFARVRAESVRTLARCLAMVTSVPRNDANIFPEYILPSLSAIAQDDVVSVRIAYAENIALLAETALRFLEISQLGTAEAEQQASYDLELQALHEVIQQRVVTLLSDADNIVKQTLLEGGIVRLCVFFGRQKANDVLLSHMITFLNDKRDWQLRGVFFDAVVGVAAYVGWQGCAMLKPLLQQGLSDTQEFVIAKALKAMKCLVELGLLQKLLVQELLVDVAPFLCHPGVWVRQGAVGFVTSVARTLNVADVHCKLLPLLQPFLSRPVIQVQSEVVLLSVLQPPVQRAVFDYMLSLSTIGAMLDHLQDRQLVRNLMRQGHRPSYAELDNGSLSQTYNKLVSLGMTEGDEDKILSLRDTMMKLHRARGCVPDSRHHPQSPDSRPGALNLATILDKSGKMALPLRQELLAPSVDGQLQSKPPSIWPVCEIRWLYAIHAVRRLLAIAHLSAWGVEKAKIDERFNARVNARMRWGGSTQAECSRVACHLHERGVAAHVRIDGHQDAPTGKTENRPAAGSTPPTVPSSEGEREQKVVQSETVAPSTDAQQPSSDALAQAPDVPPPQRKTERSNLQARAAPCKLEFKRLLARKREQWAADTITHELVSGALWDGKFPSPRWRPRGLLVAHLHEHRGAVNRIQVSPEMGFFATCSNDGTVKLWEALRMEGKSLANRSRLTYSRQGGQIKSVVFCDSAQSVASASDNGTIHVNRIEQGTPTIRTNVWMSREQDLKIEGAVVDMDFFDTGPQWVIAYATVHGGIVGWDLRAPSDAWRLKSDVKHGLITTFCVDPRQSWMAVGTASGSIVCWDLRFHLPIATVRHPAVVRVRKVLPHPAQHSWVLSSVQGNNEVSMWNVETSARQMALWASTAPALSTKQASRHSVHSMYIGPSGTRSYMLTAGSDMRIRYWDLAYAAKSFIVCGAANDPVNQTSVSYRSQLIDGTEVVQEMYNKVRRAAPAMEDMPRSGPEAPPVGHHDIISDINVCQASQPLIISASRDGVIKLWK